ncbi:2-hydroxyacid dehydrogenase family protein [Xylocopilactobacillus apicola]|uniref:2-hydroxyacid dehydrogenase n=1 Tax=Xylocopilactobacillus apicola TaxID=2932184 RepID=A0AAU9CVS3_9LACO|nr:2-hydroxyacid dehydrogenase family protein [Xylocopilactobacillus apicola]BDR58079.1 2-hydroxyacid dehydrogenase [Xylocopilactobacillus apicola]
MKVYITDRIPEIATTKLEKNKLTVKTFNGSKLITEAELIEEVADADFLITALSTKVDKNIIDHAPKLKLIANFASGFNNIDTAYARKKGICVTNTPIVSTTSVAEVTIGLILSISHRLVEGDQLMRSTGFDGWRPLFFLGHEIAGKNLGIVGLGNIGKAVANLAQSFSMNVFYWQPRRLKPEQERVLNLSYLEFDELVKTSDFISLNSPLTDDNKHQFDQNVFAQMKDSAYLINAARGPIVDEAALVSALKNKEIAGAALDVYEHEPAVSEELKSMKNVVLTPHLGNATIEARNAMAEVVVDNVMKVIRGEAVPAVN